MNNLKKILGISLPIAIIVVIISMIIGSAWLFGISLIYAIIAGIFWKFVKNF